MVKGSNDDMNTEHSVERLRSGFVRSNTLVSRLCSVYARERDEEGTSRRFVELSKGWWEKLASREDWRTAAELGELCAKVCPHEAFGWENWAWALHKQGQTKQAYKVLAPILRQLKLSGPPSGRAAYCLACFCTALGKIEEASGWLRLAALRSVNKEAFRFHVLGEPDLQSFWPKINELA